MTRILPAIVFAVLVLQAPLLAQEEGTQPQPPRPAGFTGNWPSPETLDRIRKWNPKAGPIQKPGEIQKAGEIQVPKGIEAVKASATSCETRIGVLADALFDFNKSDLRQDAGATLEAALPQIAQMTQNAARVRVEGHTDWIGSDEYNMTLSEARARTVRDWLVYRKVLPVSAEIRGYGKRKPAAPNSFEDGRDNPEGRQKNRRVEIAAETCSG